MHAHNLKHDADLENGAHIFAVLCLATRLFVTLLCMFVVLVKLVAPHHHPPSSCLTSHTSCFHFILCQLFSLFELFILTLSVSLSISAAL